jgi:hypothetical protein
MTGTTRTRTYDTPADAFEAIAKVEFFGEDLRMSREIERHPHGDTMTVTAEYRDPEGKQIGVAEFVATHERDVFPIDFGEELPDDSDTCPDCGTVRVAFAEDADQLREGAA